MSVDLRGLWVPIVTPFTTDDEIGGDALARLAGRLLDDGAVGRDAYQCHHES